jgi:hypothetical protein
MGIIQCPNCNTSVDESLPYCVNCGLKMTGDNFARLLSITSVLRDVQRQWQQAFAVLRDEQQSEYDAARPVSVTTSPVFALPETEPWTVKTTQNLLLGIGAVLVSAAALLFIVYAWSRMGLGGRTMVMLGVTTTFGGAGYVTHKRGLTATAEALTSVALALTLIDAGAAYSLDLAGLGEMSASTYWACVFGGSGALAAAYRYAVHIRVVGVYAMLATQLPVVLLLQVAHPAILVWAIGIGLQTLAMTAFTQLLHGDKALFEIGRLSVIGTWGVLAMVTGATALLNGAAHPNEYGLDVAACLITIAVAVLIGYTGKEFHKHWCRSFTTMAFALGVATAMSADLQFFHDDAVFVAFSATGIALITGVIAARQRNNTVVLMLTAIPPVVGSLFAIHPVFQGLFGSLEWTQYVWMRRFSIIDEWGVTAISVVVAALSVGALAVNGFAISSKNMMRTAMVAILGVAYLTLVASPAPYWLVVTLLTGVAVVFVVDARNRLWFGVGLAFAAQAL